MNHLSITDAYLSILAKRITSNEIQNSYNLKILKTLDVIYSLANTCRNQGKDSTLTPESELTLDMAERIDRMLKTPIAERLRELLDKYTPEQTAIIIADEIATGKFGFLQPNQILDLSVRVGLAIITEGLTIAPLQGISSVKIKANEDSSKYIAVSFAAPIRIIGSIHAAFSLVIADRVRKTIGLDNYRANAWGQDEVGRMIEELRIYEKNFTDLQFHVSDNDIRKTISHIPVQIDGVDTSQIEVVTHRAMKRIETDRIRGGALRVLNDGIIGRAKKLNKLLNDLGITDWNWLAELEGGKSNISDEDKTNTSFSDIISGRPILSKSKRIGGFRLRYGRSFNTGISTVGINPITAELLDYPIVVGTQIKIDTPRENATTGFVDSINGPIIRLKNGSVIEITTVDQLQNYKKNIEQILFLGDILISFGDFLEKNTKLSPSGYVEELWVEELRLKTENLNPNSFPIPIQRLNELEKDPFHIIPTFEEAVFLAKTLNIGLHPKYTFYWDLVTPSDILVLRKNLKIQDNTLVINEHINDIKTILEKTGIPHLFDSNSIIISNETAKVLRLVLALDKKIQLPTEWTNTCDFITHLAGFPIRNKTSIFIGVRVGKYERTTARKTKPPINIIFPTGNAKETNRDITLKTEYITAELVNLFCVNCKSEVYSARCSQCGSETKVNLSCLRCKKLIEAEICPTCKIAGYPYSEKVFPLKQKLNEAIRKVHYRPNTPMKGIQSLINSTRSPEPLEKGLLRTKYGLFVYKDGTSRLDTTNAPLTHCTPEMINVSIETLQELGYKDDINGKPLIDKTQTFELLMQDIVISDEATEFLFKVANFIDDLFIYVYEQKPFYKLKTKRDIIGHLVIGLAPQTSVGIVGRIIGFTKSHVCFAHPFWHSAKRRDCSGDSDSLILLLDALLNFSRDYLPAQIGGLIDTPLLIQSIVIPSETQKRIHDLDTLMRYPFDFYELTKTEALPSKINSIKNKTNTKEQFYNFGYTHPTSNISSGPANNNYLSKTTLIEKLENQIQLAKRIAAVNPNDVVTSVLQTHLIPDIIGNINAYTSQTFRCNSCGYQYRRLPIRGDCLQCGGKLHATVTKGIVEKYFKLAMKLCNEFNVDQQTKTRLEIIANNLKMLFKTEPVQSDLTGFLE